MAQKGECPYCDADASTGDHIFPEFMGGTRKIPSCSICNSKFGHSFEQVVDKLFLKLHLHLAANGLRLRVPLKRWRRAFEMNDENFDVVFEDGELRFLLSNPVVNVDPKTRVLNARFGSKAQAKGVMRHLRPAPLSIWRLHGP
jgi:hypothetical protein